MLAIGLMSGTSLDGIDAALVELRPRGNGYAVALQRFESAAFEPALRDELLAVVPPNDGSVECIARLHRRLGDAYARTAQTVARSSKPAFVASHGQTVWHDGAAGITLQIGDPFAIREALGTTVCYDFRSADTAAGGHGAPLVARVDALLLSDESEDRVALNLGGIANVTLLRAGAPAEEAVAFDTGPANMLLDRFVAERTHNAATYDRDGMLAANGSVDETLLAAMLADEYFAALPPKTTGRERFGSQFLGRYAREFIQMSIEDGAATLTELTAASIAQSVARAGFSGARVIVSGGGAHNRALLARLAARLGGARVETSDAMGIPIDAKEAIAFAVLGYETLRGRAGNVPAATGARHAAVLGAIAPFELSDLLEAIARECAAQ
jgi:anhydro-N-acetylmuramic acid kinase